MNDIDVVVERWDCWEWERSLDFSFSFTISIVVFTLAWEREMVGVDGLEEEEALGCNESGDCLFLYHWRDSVDNECKNERETICENKVTSCLLQIAQDV